MARRGIHSLIEPLLIGLAVVVSSWFVASTYYRNEIRAYSYYGGDGRMEMIPLEALYGPARASENFEEWILRDYFQDRRDGIFLDVGAHHYRNASNTFYLESQLGWSGIAIDALEEFAADYRTYRPRTRFVAAFVGDVDEETVQFFVSNNNKLVASATAQFTRDRAWRSSSRDLHTTTLNTILEQAGVGRIDYLSMDIELSEPKALAGFDIRRYRPLLACIEAHPETRQQILDYFAHHGYTVIGKYLRLDPKNLYFMPLTYP